MDLSTCEENENDPTVNIDASQPLFSQDLDMDCQQVVGM